MRTDQGVFLCHRRRRKDPFHGHLAARGDTEIRNDHSGDPCHGARVCILSHATCQLLYTVPRICCRDESPEGSPQRPKTETRYLSKTPALTLHKPPKYFLWTPLRPPNDRYRFKNRILNKSIAYKGKSPARARTLPFFFASFFQCLMFNFYGCFTG